MSVRDARRPQPHPTLPGQLRLTEGDLLIGLERSAVGTVVERKTRYTMLVHLPREEGYRRKETPKNGPALAGYGALTMKTALANTMSTLPEQLARSLTWDRGKEMSTHAQFKIETGIPVFFADPQSPWQRGTNENTVSIEQARRWLSQAGVGNSRRLSRILTTLRGVSFI
jgi:IS30 family transposase